MGLAPGFIRADKFAQVDIDRFRRRGFPEVIYCPGKRKEQIKRIAGILLKSRQPLLLTRLDKKTFSYLKKYYPQLKYNPKGKVAYLKIKLFKKDASAIFINYGLTFPQYNVLRVLSESKNGQNTITATGKVLLVTGANMTGIAKRLEKNGFIIRRGDPNDERVTILEITPKGRQTLKNISKEKDENIDRYFIDSADSEKKQLLKNLRKLIK